MKNLEAFSALVQARRSVRHFKPDPLPDGLLERLLDATRWAPSGYNLQPTHFVAVTDAALKKQLRQAAMEQKQIAEAPAVVLFAGDRGVHERHLDKMLAADRDAGAISAEYEVMIRKYVLLAFSHGPGKVGWLWKAGLAPLLRPFVPLPSIPAVEKRFWLAKQAALSAMVFMLAATAAGLATVPMEGFDESRVRSILGIPRAFVPLLLVPVGYAANEQQVKTRLPLKDLVHHNGW